LLLKKHTANRKNGRLTAKFAKRRNENAIHMKQMAAIDLLKEIIAEDERDPMVRIGWKKQI
jgi:hypothetical protein